MLISGSGDGYKRFPSTHDYTREEDMTASTPEPDD